MSRKRQSVPKVLIDTNILLDVILGRSPWSIDAALLMDAASHGACEGFLAGHSVTTVQYIVQRELGRQRAAAAVSGLLTVLRVVGLEHDDFLVALTLGLADFEDAVQVATALKCGADFIATRNVRDFRGVDVPLRSAGEIVAFLSASTG